MHNLTSEAVRRMKLPNKVDKAVLVIGFSDKIGTANYTTYDLFHLEW
jgi:hypothetical protein